MTTILIVYKILQVQTVVVNWLWHRQRKAGPKTTLITGNANARARNPRTNPQRQRRLTDRLRLSRFRRNPRAQGRNSRARESRGPGRLNKVACRYLYICAAEDV